MPVKIFKISSAKALNCKIHPVLYNFFLHLKDRLGAELVHRRKRASSTCVEIIFWCEEIAVISGHLNTQKEAEKCGFWVICRPQNNPKHMFYKGHRVFLLYMTPVHPKRCRETQHVVTPLNSAVSAENTLASIG